jgi:hypothetical protein
MSREDKKKLAIVNKDRRDYVDKIGKKSMQKRIQQPDQTIMSKLFQQFISWVIH